MSDGTWEIPGGETVRKATQVERVLADLIADLRAHCREPSCHCDIGKAADHAESRLRTVRDD